MQIDCPRCRRLLEYSGERPSFCAYCGAGLVWPEGQTAVGVEQEAAGTADTDPERTGPYPLSPQRLAETMEYRSSRPSRPHDGEEDLPERIAGYRLIRKLGSGGMGTVFEAEDEGQRQRVAIKLIAREYVTSQEAVDRFRQEGRLASAVTHPRCVFVLAVDEHVGRPYIVMELMPGTTLQTLVEKGGPIEPADAIVKIFDVIEGLEEFHKRGLIHRDVKPSNCFLENEGRVKIGDFGLSKSLEGGADLTRTGTFVGTPLYSSPEQIKRDEVDERTDVYSVAATLYYLLTGRPPVQAKDAAEALARIASEPAPMLRTYRPDIPRALEAVIHRGLERDPTRRWRSLREFHDALAPFVPDRLSIASVGLRLGAYVVDIGMSYLMSWAVVGLVTLGHQVQVMETLRFYERNRYLLGWLERLLWFLYFAVPEGLVGASLGKWLMGLRVSRVGRGGPPGLGRGVVRTLIFYALTELPADLIAELTPPFQGPRMFLKFWAYERTARAVGLLALLTTMREKSGFRGPHEWLSGTRVVRVMRMWRPRPNRRLQLLADSRLSSGVYRESPGGPVQIGPYQVREAVSRDGRPQIVLGHDSTLERPVWIALRAPGATPLSQARRTLNRRSRPRWIGGGDEPDFRWDAFTAAAAIPLPELVTSEGLPWSDVLPILRDLVEELQAARADGTTPRVLSTDQVWVQADGGVQLVDVLDQDTGGASHVPHTEEPRRLSEKGSLYSSISVRFREPLATRALTFLGDVARLALEGRRPSTGSPSGAGFGIGVSGTRSDRQAMPVVTSSWGRPIRAAVPERAALVLERLTGVRAPYTSLVSLRADLDDAASRPTEVSPVRRAIHLSIQGFFLLPGLFLMYFLSSGQIRPRAYAWDLETLLAIPLCWVLWAMMARGGVSLPLAGIALVASNGRRPSASACGWRAFLVWAPPAILLSSSLISRETAPEAPGLSLALWITAVVLLFIYIVLALLFPSRCLHDRLARTVLVPL
jgi:hypothetical protein